MGMFDTVLVAKNLLDNVIKDTDIILEASSDGYFDFQTKDLDNFLTTFFIDEDGSFSWNKLNQEYIPPVETGEKKKGFNFGEWRQISPPEKILDTRTAYIEFYDFYNTETERVFVTFLAHVKCGKLVEPISIKEVERTNLEQEAIKNKKNKAKWDLVRDTWEWKISDAISNSRWKVRRFFQPLFKSLDDLENKLRKTAKSKFLDEKDIGNW
jgi:hypothetical protein